MTDSLADVLAAVTVGQSLTAAGSSYARSQSWRYALEKAYTQNEWIMRAADVAAGSASETGANATQTSQKLSVSAPETSDIPWLSKPGGTPHDAVSRASTARSVDLRTKLGSPGWRTTSAAVWQAQAPSRPVMLTANPLSAAKPAAGIPNSASQSADPLPRSVHLISVNGQLQVVVRDEAIKGPMLTKLIARIRDLMARLGEELGKIVVNGSEVWSEPADAAPPYEGKSPPTIEVLY